MPLPCRQEQPSEPLQQQLAWAALEGTVDVDQERLSEQRERRQQRRRVRQVCGALRPWELRPSRLCAPLYVMQHEAECQALEASADRPETSRANMSLQA